MTDETQRFRADGPADPGDALLGHLRRVAALVDPVPEALVHRQHLWGSASLRGTERPGLRSASARRKLV